MSKENQTVLSLYPNRVGLGYALFNNPKELIEYGVNYVQPVSNRKTMKRVREYIKHYKPDIVLVRNVNDRNTGSMKRIKKLIDLICNEAKRQNLEIHSYTRTQIKNVFDQFGATTKYEISQKIIEWYEELESQEFPKRNKWMEENPKNGVFDAVSTALTHWYLN